MLSHDCDLTSLRESELKKQAADRRYLFSLSSGARQSEQRVPAPRVRSHKGDSSDAGS